MFIKLEEKYLSVANNYLKQSFVNLPVVKVMVFITTRPSGFWSCKIELNNEKFKTASFRKGS